LVSTRAEDEYKDSYYLIARGNHEEAVKTALDEVLPSSSDAAAAPVTLHAVATSKAVQALSRTSAEWREMHLRKLAAAFGWEVANNVTLDQETHFVKQTHAVGNPAPAGVSSAAKRANYIVYHTATDPSTSSGGSVVFHGSYASYTWYVGKKKGGPDGRPTQAFPVRTEERPFSVLPAHSGEHAGPDSHRVPSRHVRMSSKTKAEATRRITWHSEIQSYNPHVLKVHNAPDHSWQQLERSFGANAGGPIKKQSMQILFSRVPGMHVSHLPFTKLKSYLKVLKEPVLPVAIDGDAVAGIQTHWHAIRQAVPDKTSSFASVFDDQVNETHVRINTDILRALAKITDSTDANEA